MRALCQKNNYTDHHTHTGLLGLPETMNAILSLLVIMRVVIDVVNDHRVRPGEVHARTPGTGREKEQLDGRTVASGWKVTRRHNTHQGNIVTMTETVKIQNQTEINKM